jgi:hypothetical protein
MLYVIFDHKFDNQLTKTMWKTQHKPIENCHVENVVIGKDFNLVVTS